MTFRPDRRQFLAAAALTAPLITAGRLFAAPSAGSRLLVVFLRGAYDAASFLVPVDSDFYYASRPNIAIARPDPANPLSAIPIAPGWGLHPAVRESLLPLWTKGQIAFAPFAGTDDLSRSHFETQDTIELGQPVGGRRDFGSGFLGRLHGALAGDVRPIAFTQQAPLSFRGGSPIPNIALNTAGKPAVDAHEAALISAMYKGRPLSASVDEGFKVDDQVFAALGDDMAKSGRGAISAKGFELSARRIGRLMRDQFNLAFVDVGGWDTHVGQGAAQGNLAGRLGELGRGLAGFAEEIGPSAWDKTVVVTISEFGRTFRENGDRGTDHGHGSVYWILGGGVKGGRILGDRGPVTEAELNQNRDYPVAIDYRDLLGGLFRRMYGLDSARLQSVFPSTQPRDFALV
jgi:uncharacterized protein (DUF1501 family)